MTRAGRIAALLIGAALNQAQAQPASTLRAGAVHLAPATHMDGATTLLVENVLPWGFDSNETVLGGLGVAYDTVGSKDFGSVELSQYRTIIVASVQKSAFYAAVGRHAEAIERWLRNGARTLEFHAARQASEVLDFDLPGGVRVVYDTQDVDQLAGNDSPLLAGLPQQMHGSYASHVAFLRRRVVDDAVLMVTTEGVERPVMLDYCVGPGRVIATGQTVEFAYAYGWDFAQVLPNMLSASTLTPGCPG